MTIERKEPPGRVKACELDRFTSKLGWAGEVKTIAAHDSDKMVVSRKQLTRQLKRIIKYETALEELLADRTVRFVLSVLSDVRRPAGATALAARARKEWVSRILQVIEGADPALQIEVPASNPLSARITDLSAKSEVIAITNKQKRALKRISKRGPSKAIKASDLEALALEFGRNGDPAFMAAMTAIHHMHLIDHKMFTMALTPAQAKDCLGKIYTAIARLPLLYDDLKLPNFIRSPTTFQGTSETFPLSLPLAGKRYLDQLIKRLDKSPGLDAISAMQPRDRRANFPDVSARRPQLELLVQDLLDCWDHFQLHETSNRDEVAFVVSAVQLLSGTSCTRDVARKMAPRARAALDEWLAATGRSVHRLANLAARAGARRMFWRLRSEKSETEILV